MVTQKKKENQQFVLTLSKTQEGYIILVEGIKEATWIKWIIDELESRKNVQRYMVIAEVPSIFLIVKCIMKG